MGFLEWAAVVLGGLGIAASHFFAEVPRGFFHFGIGLIGAGIVLGGVESILTRRVGFRLQEDSGEDYSGTPAVIVGLMALLVGAAVVGAAYLHAEGRWHATLNALARHPAPALIAAGLFVAGAGTLLLFMPGGREGLVWMVLVRAPRLLLGVALLLGGFALVALGGWEFAQPLAFDRLIRSLPSQLHWLAR
jgi:hypothetical protein